MSDHLDVTSEYVVVRLPTRRVDKTPRGANNPPPIPTTSKERLTAGEAGEIEAERDVLGVVRDCKLSLVRPVSSSHANPQDVGPSPWGLDAIKAITSPFNGRGVKVAVLDTGIDRYHPVFAGLRGSITNRNFTHGLDEDTDGHGTHCAGTIAGGLFGDVQIGVAPELEHLYVGKVISPDGTATSNDLVRGILWAMSEGADIISMSLAINLPARLAELTHRFPDVNKQVLYSEAFHDHQRHLQLFTDIASVAHSSGQVGRTIALVAAAGNDSDRRLNPPRLFQCSPPASATGFLAVGAVGRTASGLAVAPFSNGDLDLLAPGVDIVSAQSGGGLAHLSGTSMAVPHVTGVIALWLEKLRRTSPAVNLATLNARLWESATPAPIAVQGSDIESDARLVQAPQQ